MTVSHFHHHHHHPHHHRRGIHEALRHGSSLEYLERLLRQHPESVRRQDGQSGGALPLHTAVRCMRNDPDECLQVAALLLRHDPRAAQRCDWDSNLPLHAAVQVGAHAEVVERIWRAFPDAAVATNSRNQYPLHVALECDNLDGALGLLMLLDTADATATTTSTMAHRCVVSGNEAGVPPALHKVLSLPFQPRRLPVIRRLLQMDPTVMVSSSSACNHRSSCLPMHLACQLGHPVAVLELLYQANPKCLEYKDNNNNLPLCSAIRSGCSLDTLDWLLDRMMLLPNFDKILTESVQLALTCPQASVALCERLMTLRPETLTTPLSGGGLMLHWFLLEQQQGCRYSTNAFWIPRLEMLLHQCPQAARHADDQGRLPLHIVAAATFQRAVGFGAGGASPVACLKRLLDTHPTGLVTPNNQGQLPLHVLLTDENNRTGDAGGKNSRRNRRRRVLSLQILNLFLEAPGGTAALRHADQLGRHPLHVACQQSSHWCSNATILQRLVEADPTGTLQIWHDGLPHMLAAARHDAPLEVIWFWAQRSPELILRGTTKQKDDSKGKQRIVEQ